MNDDNNLGFDRYNHEDYNSNGLRKEMNPIGDISDYNNSNVGYGRVNTHHSGLVRSAKFAALPFLLVFVILLFVYVFLPLFKTDPNKEFEQLMKNSASNCSTKLNNYLSNKYKGENFSFTSNITSSKYCDFTVTIKEEQFQVLFNLDAKEDEYYDNYQSKIVKDALTKEFELKYNLKLVGLDSTLDADFEPGRGYVNYFNKYFNGSNYNEIFKDSKDVTIRVEGDLNKDASKFITNNKLKNASIRSISDNNRYMDFGLSGESDLESYYLDKVIIMEDGKLSYYNYETVKTHGIYLVFKGTSFDINSKTVVNEIDDKCSDVIYRGFNGDIAGVLKGNIVNVFSNDIDKVTINGDSYELKPYSTKVKGNIKIGLENGHIRVCKG